MSVPTRLGDPSRNRQHPAYPQSIVSYDVPCAPANEGTPISCGSVLGPMQRGPAASHTIGSMHIRRAVFCGSHA
jgi:hypothetical protein